MPDPIDTEALRAKAAAATPGPWVTTTDRPTWITCVAVDHIPIDEADWGEEVGNEFMVRTVRDPAAWSYADTAFIAAANPATVLALLDEIDRLRAALARFSPTCREHGCLTAPPTEVPCAIPATDPGSETP